MEPKTTLPPWVKFQSPYNPVMEHSILCTTIYVVQGHKIEPLLGDEDAKALGIHTVNKGGYTPHTCYITTPMSLSH